MCIQCHRGLCDSDIEKQLSSILDNPEFEKTKETTISHICLAAKGINGTHAKEIALKIIEAYIEWKKNNTLENDDSLFGQPSANTVQDELDIIRKFNEICETNNLTQEDIKDLFYHDDKNNENYYAKISNDKKFSIFMTLKQCVQYGINGISVFMNMVSTKIKYLIDQIINFTNRQKIEG